MSQRNEKIKLLTGVAEIYGFNFTDVSIEIYLEALYDIHSEDLKRILGYGMRANLWKSMPRPGEVLSVIRLSAEDRQTLNGKSEFDEIMRTIRQVGRHGCPHLSEAGQNALRQIGGMNRIADATDEDMVWIRKDFDSCYEINTSKTQVDSRRLKLVGSEKLTDQRSEMKQLFGGLANKMKMPD